MIAFFILLIHSIFVEHNVMLSHFLRLNLYSYIVEEQEEMGMLLNVFFSIPTKTNRSWRG